MKFRYVLPFVLFAAPVFAQTSSDMVAQQIGQLTIQNANLAEQLNKANAKIRELEAKLPKETPPPPAEPKP
jgi:hypothetical protein